MPPADACLTVERGAGAETLAAAAACGMSLAGAAAALFCVSVSSVPASPGLAAGVDTGMLLPPAELESAAGLGSTGSIAPPARALLDMAASCCT